MGNQVEIEDLIATDQEEAGELSRRISVLMSMFTPYQAFLALSNMSGSLVAFIHATQDSEDAVSIERVIEDFKKSFDASVAHYAELIEDEKADEGNVKEATHVTPDTVQ